jgi:hypothetical protein
MYKFIIKFDGIFNKILIASVLIFIGFVLGGCSPRQHGNTHQLANQYTPAISTARSEYEAMQKFKAQHVAFYSSLRK